MELPEKNTKSHGIKFYSMSLPRLYFLTIITFGIYEIYWFYRNWKAIKEAHPQKMSPFWRSIFQIFYAWPLFKEIKESAHKHGYKVNFSAGGLALVYAVILLVSNGVSRIPEYNSGVIVATIILALIYALPLFPIQKAINFNNRKQPGPEPEKGTTGEVILIFVGALITVGIIYAFVTAYQTPAQNTGTYPNTSITPEVQTAKDRMDSLTTQYENCSSDLAAREATVDRYSQYEVDSYNADWQDCEDIRLRQNAAVETYNGLIGQ